MSFRKSCLGALVGATSALVLAGAAAFACTNLAVLSMSSTAGKVGDQITVTGSSFRVNSANLAASDPVILRWNSVDGPELARSQPDKAGNISAQFTIPDSPPNHYVVMAVQRDARGVNAGGTPARASFQILGASGPPPALSPPSSTGAAAAAPSSSTGMVALTVGLGVTGFALFGFGFVAMTRQRRRDLPVTATVSKREK